MLKQEPDRSVPTCNLCGLSCRLGQHEHANSGGLERHTVTGNFDSTAGNGHGCLDDFSSYTFSLCEWCLDWLFGEMPIPPIVREDIRGENTPAVFRPAAKRVAEDDWRRDKEGFAREKALRDDARRPAGDVDVFRRELLAVWHRGCAYEAALARLQGLPEFAAFSGAAKDLLLALGLDWDVERDDYVFARAPWSEEKAPPHAAVDPHFHERIDLGDHGEDRGHVEITTEWGPMGDGLVRVETSQDPAGNDAISVFASVKKAREYAASILRAADIVAKLGTPP